MDNLYKPIFLLISFSAIYSGPDKHTYLISDPWSDIIVEGQKATASLNLYKLKMNLYNSPQVQERVLSDAVLNMPVRSGKKEAFRFYQTNVMPEVLADKYPEIKSFMGIGLNDPSTRASIVINNNTIHGMVISDIGNSFFTAADHQNNEPVTISDGSEQNELMTCDIEKKFIESSRDLNDDVFPECVGDEDPCIPIGDKLVTFRFAGIVTEDVNNDISDGTVSGGLSWLVAMLNQVNLLWIRDLSFQLQLVGDNDQIIHTNANPAPDQFKQECPESGNPRNCELPEVEPYLETTIGPGGWDDGDDVRVWEYGACFDIGYGGGLAWCPGPTSVNSPSFAVFAHEIMHNLGSNHNITREDGFRSSIGGNIMYWVAPPAVVPGNTGMTYTSHSLEVALNNKTNLPLTYSDCAYAAGYSSIETNNIIPDVIVPDGGWIIPKDTPFRLEGYSSPMYHDYTFSWEQNDASGEIYENDPQSNEFSYFPASMGPLFSTVDPSTNGYIRYFPDLGTLLDNNYETYDAGYFTTLVMEKLPFASREMNMRMIVRTNDPYSGSVNHKNVQFFVAGSAGPFRVTSQQSSSVWSIGDQKTVTWDVADTDNPDSVNCQHVDIVLSLDGGENFDVIIFENVPNTGSYSFNVPPLPSSISARLMVRSVNNIFFDINNGNIEIQNSNVPNVVFMDEVISVSQQTGQTQNYSVPFSNNGEDNSVLNFSSGVGFEYAVNENFDDLELSTNTSYLMYDLPDGWIRSSLGRGWIIGTEDSSAWEDWILSQVGPGNFDISDWSGGNYIFTDDEQYNYCISCMEYSECYEQNGCSDGTLDLLYTPLISVPQTGNSYLLFDSFFGYTGSGHQIHIGVVTGDISNWETVLTLTSGQNQFVPLEVDLSDFAGEDIRIVFHSEETASDGWGAGWAVDNVRFASSPSWLESNGNGILVAGQTAELNFTVNTTGMNVGNYQASLVVSDISHNTSDTILVSLNTYLETEKELLPYAFDLKQNFPNPFNPTTDITFSLPNKDNTSLNIFDLMGNTIETVTFKNLEPGVHTYRWNATNKKGQKVSAGIYFYGIQTSDRSLTKKMILLK